MPSWSPASDGIMLMYDLWRAALFYLLLVTQEGCFISCPKGVTCLFCSHCQSARVLRTWWKCRGTLSRWQTSIRGVTCQMVKAEYSHLQGDGRVPAQSGGGLSMKTPLALLLLILMVRHTTLEIYPFRVWGRVSFTIFVNSLLELHRYWDQCCWQGFHCCIIFYFWVN